MLYITHDVSEKIKLEGEKAYPNECCGIIYGKIYKSGEKSAEKIEPVKNTFEKEEYKTKRFLINPQEMMNAEIYARKEKIDIVGFYHSHPNCKAIPSEYDRTHALPAYSYVIVSVVGSNAVDFASWELFNRSSKQIFSEEIINFI